MSFYNHIREIFRFSERDDYLSAQLLNNLVKDSAEDGEISDIIKNKSVAVIGAGPSLTSVREIDADVIIASDGVTNYLVKELDITPDIIVTDLDGISIFPKESIYVVLAHGDNIDLLYKVFYMKKVVPTCQVFPFGRLKLYGGFTDGDRAVVLAKRFGASSIKLLGMDFNSDLIGRYSKPYFTSDVPMSWVKRMKLKIGKMIVSEILSMSDEDNYSNDKILWALHGSYR
ncbi:MAG: DUF115 domain-containing protein [Sulfolobus sp.]|nr:DUF115 domain-containing protein [Sulfolobus sp.]